MIGKTFEELLQAHDLDGVRARMTSRNTQVSQALFEYDPKRHNITSRQDKVILDAQSMTTKRIEKLWKLPIPYQQYINEVALVFLYGAPIKWICGTDDTDNAFKKFNEVLKSTHFDSAIRQCKRLAGAETQSAMLVHLYKDSENKPNIKLRVLARSKGDEIYTRFDPYENLTAFAWGYYAEDKFFNTVYHLDLFTSEKVYRGVQDKAGWTVTEEPNILGKIPVILFEQDKEWSGVEALIEREEYIASHTADSNDYFSDPLMVISSDLLQSMPDKGDTAKTLITNNPEGVNNVVKYLTWDSAPQSKKDELDWLQDQILNKTFTPRISLDTLKSLGNLSGKALQTVMLLANIKANRHKERHDELLDRFTSLILTAIAKVLDVSLLEECERIHIDHKFQNPFGNDTQSDIQNLLTCIEGGLMSQETGVEMNPLLSDSTREKERLSEQGDGGQEL